MSAAVWFVVVPTVCYAGAACVYAWNRDWPLAVVYSGYMWANLGLIVISK